MSHSVLVTGLPMVVDSSTLEDMFNLIGHVVSARIEVDETSKVSKGVGIVEMFSGEDVENCIRYYNGQNKNGFTIFVRENKPHVPRVGTSSAKISKALDKLRSQSAQKLAAAGRR